MRYADDFKIICRDWKTAQRWYHAVVLYLKDRLKLDVSPEKSQIINQRKRESEFLGFTIRANKKVRKELRIQALKPTKGRKSRAKPKNTFSK